MAVFCKLMQPSTNDKIRFYSSKLILQVIRDGSYLFGVSVMRLACTALLIEGNEILRKTFICLSEKIYLLNQLLNLAVIREENT